MPYRFDYAPELRLNSMFQGRPGQMMYTYQNTLRWHWHATPSFDPPPSWNKGLFMVLGVTVLVGVLLICFT